MKRVFLVGIFSTLALAPFQGSIAQTNDNTSDVKAVETAKNHTTAGVTGAATTATPDVTSNGPTEAQKNFDNGVSLYNAGKLADAVLALKEANKLKPDDAQTNYMLGMSYWKLKNYYQAADAFKRAVKVKPDWDEAYFRLGLTYYVLGRTGPSMDIYKKLQDLNPSLAAKLYRVIGDPNTPIPPETAKTKLANTEVSAPVSTSTNSNSSNEKSNAPVSNGTRLAGNETPNSAADANAAPVKRESAAVSTADKPTPTENNTANTTALEPSGAPAKSNEDVPLTEIYRVGVGDVLDIHLLNSAANRSTLFSVIDGGYVDFPIAGAPIAVAGLTTKEIQTRIAAELKRLAVADQTQVSVGVRQYGSHTVVVTGLVGNPGAKVLRREAVPLYVLLSEVQPRLDAARATIMRTGSSPQVLDLSDPAALNFVVRTNDVINLTARQQDFYYIAGKSVGYPGQKAFQPGITLVQAILAAGGLARDGAVEISRQGPDGHLTTTKLNLKEIKAGKAEDPKLEPGDRIELLH